MQNFDHGNIDSIKWQAEARVFRYSPEQISRLAQRLGITVDQVGGRELQLLNEAPADGIAEAHGNLLTTVGLARITALITGGAGQAMTNAQMMVGVGISSTAATVADTDLGAATGASNRYIQGADATYPSVSNGVITGYSTFASGNANFAWAEWAWGIATGALTPGTGSWSSIAATSAVMLNHKVQSLGTKVSGAVWQLQSTITLS